MKDVCALIQRVLNTGQPVDMTTVPKNIGAWDSLNHLHVITALEETYQVVFDPEEITICADGVNSIIRLLHTKGVVLADD